MNKLLFSFFLLLSSIIFSQKTGKQDDGLITGKIVDASTSKPLDYVSFRLFKVNETKVISGIYTDNSGKINLENVSFGTFYAVCSFSGYENDTIKDIILSLNSKVYNIGTIKLNPIATNLKEFEVVGNMDVLKAGIDKKIYNVGEDLSVKGGTANDILTRLPSVELDQEGKISLRGEGTVTVLIDGRPSSISGGNGKTLLDALPAGSIERIEIVTNPSAKYDPDGNSGIINIVLKKNKLKGFNGLVSTNLASGNIRNGNVAESNLSLSYRNGAVNVYGIYSYRYLEGYRNNDSYINQTNTDGSRFILNQYRTGTDLNAGHTFRTGADFNLKDRQTLGISATGSIGVRDRTGDLWNSVYDTLNNRTNLWERTSYDPSQQQNLDFNANYRYDFKKDRGNLVIDATQSLGKEGIQGYYQENYYEPDSVLNVGIDPLKQQLFNKEKNNITTLQADLTYLFPKISARMETGLKTILRDQQVDTESESFDYTSNQFIPDTLANFLYQYKERIHSAYGVFGQQLGKFKYQGGIRLEQAYQLPNLVSEGININNPPYFNIFPSAHIRYEIVPKSEFSLSYSKRITRPASADMNPFTNYSDPFNLRRGNPYLKPEYTDSYDFGFIHDRKKYSVTSSVYYRNSKGVISRVKEYYENNTSAVTFMNIAETHSLGSDVVVNVKPNSWWKTSLSWNGNYIWYVTNQESLPNRQGYFHNFKFNSSIEFWKKTASLQVSVTYNGKRVTVQGIAQRQGPTDIAFEKRISNGKWTLGARVSDVFNVQGFYFKVDRPTVEQTSNFKWMTRRFYFSASYKFGKLEMNNKKLPGGEGGGDM
jgi:outer membrane receptor protein involved in Fe transport